MKFVTMRMKHKHKSRCNYQQHGPGVVCINRTLIQQRLLVKFSCDFYINSLLRALLPCVIIGLCVQWLLQQYPSQFMDNIYFFIILPNLFQCKSILFILYQSLLTRLSSNFINLHFFIQEPFRPRVIYLQSLFLQILYQIEYLVYKPNSYTVILILKIN